MFILHLCFLHFQANDIAVVELPEPLVFNNTVRPICLGLEEDNPFGRKAVATGWGDTTFSEYEEYWEDDTHK